MKRAKETQLQPQWVRVSTALRVVEIGVVTLYAHIKAQTVQSRNVKKPGNVRGIRLIYLPSLLALVEKSDSGLAPGAKKK